MRVVIECSCGVTFEFKIISIEACTLKNGYVMQNQCKCPMCDKIYSLKTICSEVKNESTTK